MDRQVEDSESSPIVIRVVYYLLIDPPRLHQRVSEGMSQLVSRLLLLGHIGQVWIDGSCEIGHFLRDIDALHEAEFRDVQLAESFLGLVGLLIMVFPGCQYTRRPDGLQILLLPKSQERPRRLSLPLGDL